jgi:hypothetical protein
MFGNSSVRDLDAAEKQALVDGRLGRLCPLKKLGQKPPTYSGDFMQCIEYVDAIICDAWWKLRFQCRSAGDLEAGYRDLSGIVRDGVSAESVRSDEHKVCTRVDHICKKIMDET